MTDPPLPKAKVGHCASRFRLVAQNRDDFHDCEVAVAVIVRAICRILAYDPVIRMQRCTAILEHHEIVIPLIPSRLGALSVVQVE